MPADHRAQAEAAANELASSLMRGVGGQNATMQAEALDRLTRRIAPVMLRFAAERIREAAVEMNRKAVESEQTMRAFPESDVAVRTVWAGLALQTGGCALDLEQTAAALDAARKEAQP